MIGTVLLAGGLIALCFPVFLGSYDNWGFQIKCGNGYYAESVQATVDGQQSASGLPRPPTTSISATAHWHTDAPG